MIRRLFRLATLPVTIGVALSAAGAMLLHHVRYQAFGYCSLPRRLRLLRDFWSCTKVPGDIWWAEVRFRFTDTTSAPKYVWAVPSDQRWRTPADAPPPEAPSTCNVAGCQGGTCP